MIREAANEDIPELLRLLKQVNNVHAEGRPDLFIMDCTKYTAKELEELLREKDKRVFVYPAGQGIKGYAFTVLEEYCMNNLVEHKTLYIDDICVDENCRGQHVGTALYEHVINYARELDCYNVTLNVWSKNPAARSFYDAMGMHPYKTCMETIL